MFRALLISFLIAFSLNVAGGDRGTLSSCDILQVSVLSSNKVLLFGVEMELAELSIAFQDAAKNDGVVLYFNENNVKDNQSVSSQIVQMVIDHQLPITMSFEADFSDLVYPYGNLKPR